MRILIYDFSLSGHHLEYLHYYYQAASLQPENEFVFCIPSDFEEKKRMYEWKEKNNVTFHYIDNETIDSCNKGNICIKGIKKSKAISIACKKYACNEIFLTMLMEVVPFILFFIPKNTKISGILYQIYLYEIEQISFIKKIVTTTRFWFLTKSKKSKRVFVLNDKESANKFNNIYHTNIFCHLPDPIPEIYLSECRDLREELNIKKDDKIVLHFGGLEKRKGTLDILKAIIQNQDNTLDQTTFVFAGKIGASIKDEFYSLYNIAKQKVNIYVFDEFCPYQFIYNLCFTSDVILMPYYFSNLSSGVLGYASVFKKPVIGPSKGLIGNIINKYNMGITLDSISPKNILMALQQTISYKENNYSNINSQRKFIDSIFS